MVIVIIATASGPGLLLVSLFHVMRITIIGEEGRVRLIKVWATMVWVGLSIRFLNHLLLVRLGEKNFLSGLLSQRLLCITVDQTLWSMLATSTRE